MLMKSPQRKSPAAARKASHRMRTLVGVRSLKEARFFLTHGADEVYCGICEIPNHGLRAENCAGIEEIHGIIDFAHSLDKKAFLVANDVFPMTAFPDAARRVAALVRRGVDGVIIRDLALLDYFRKRRLDAYFVLSTLGLCFNAASLEFFKGRGISRIVLPQQLTPDEARPMFDKKLGLDIEVFCLPLFYEVNLNALCSLSCPCSREITPGKAPVEYTCLSRIKCANGSYSMPLPDTETLLGYFYEFYHMGANCMKVARGPNVTEVVELFHKSLYLTKLLEKGISRESFVFEGKRACTAAQNYGKRYIVKHL
jgi:hypothetical protein